MELKFDKRTSEENLRKIAEEAGVELTEEMSKEDIYQLLEVFTAEPQENDDPPEKEKESESDFLNVEELDPAKVGRVIGAKEVTMRRCGGYKQYAYAGPTIRGTKLKENAIFRGSLEDVLKHLEKDLEEYPEAMDLIVQTEKLAEYKQKKEKRGNVIYNKYKSISSTSFKKN